MVIGGKRKKKIGLYTHYRNLYQRVSLPDNFTDSEFFTTTLQVNPNPTTYSKFGAILKSSRATLQFCVTVLFMVIYYHLSCETLEPIVVLPVTIVTTVVGYCVYQVYPVTSLKEVQEALIRKFPAEHAKVSIVYLIFSYQLAPILRTLTETVSTDTIHATSISMLCVHLITSEYGVSAFLVSKTTSVNAAVIGSICLASRMSTDLHSLSLLTLAVQSFVLFPIFSDLLWDSLLALLLLIISTSLACISVSFVALLIFLQVVFCISILFPLLFVWSTHAKTNIYGPWDEATPS